MGNCMGRLCILESTMVDRHELKEALHYNPETGGFTWLVSSDNRMKALSAAGATNEGGYRQIKYKGVSYKAHRLAFLYMTGSWPVNEVDHINGIRDDNRWCNLRGCTRSENTRNSKLRSNSTSGYKGVSWIKHAKKWRAYISINGRNTYIGYFDTALEAHQAYCAAADKWHGDFANHGD